MGESYRGGGKAELPFRQIGPQTVLDDDTVLLEFALGDEQSWLWAVTPGEISTTELPAHGRIDTAARAGLQLGDRAAAAA